MSQHRLLDAFTHLLWPPRCAACSARIVDTDSEPERGVFCPSCAPSLMFVTTPFCSICGLPYGGTGPDHLCANCIDDPPPFQNARAAVLYGGAVAQAIQRFKYSPTPELARPLCRLFESLIEKMTAPEIVIPVPLHAKKLRARGFNQSALLARPLARAFDAPFRPDLLRRIRDTQSQAGLSRKERTTNLKGAFGAHRPEKIENKKVLLVDDVITTTATIREAAQTIIEAGAQTVEVIALARASGPTVATPLNPEQ